MTIFFTINGTNDILNRAIIVKTVLNKFYLYSFCGFCSIFYNYEILYNFSVIIYHGYLKAMNHRLQPIYHIFIFIHGHSNIARVFPA